MARVPEVLVVDQDPQARYEVRSLIKQAQLAVGGEAALGTEAASLASEVKPDVVVLGISDPPERSLQTIESLLDILPETPIIAYAWQEDLETVRQTMLAGARDFLVMPVETERIASSIRSVLESEERKRLRLSGQIKGLGPRGLVITVFGAKGGVGKSTLASNLGVALGAELGQSVVLVDADTSFGDVAALLDIRPERTIVDLTRDIDAIERKAVTDYLVPHESGLWVLAAPRDSLSWRYVTPERYRKTLGLLAKRFDVAIIDSVAALTELSLTALEESNMVLWVTSSDFSSINNSIQGLESLHQLSYPDSRIRLMLNVVSRDDGVRPAKIEEALGRQFFWHIPYDRLVRLGGQVGRPVVMTHPASRGARNFVDLAQALIGMGARPKPKVPAWRRVIDRRPAESSSATAVEGRP